MNLQRAFSKVLFLLLISLMLPTCEVDFIPTTTLDLSSSNTECSAIFMGKVLDSSNLNPIGGVNIFSEDFNFLTFSNGDGTYRIQLEFDDTNLPNTPQIIKVTSNGYVPSTIEINLLDYYFNCDVADIIVDLDFVLTPIAEEIMTSQFTIVEEMEVTLAEVDYNPDLDYTTTTTVPIINKFIGTIQRGAFSGAPNLSITPINADQYLGVLEPTTIEGSVLEYESMVQRFYVEGNAQPNLPLLIRFNIHSFDIELGDELKYYILNEETNRWEEDPTASITYEEDDETAVLSFLSLNPGLITNASKIFTIENSTIEIAPVIRRPALEEDITNCDCRDPENLPFTVDIEQSDQELLMQESSINLQNALRVINNFKVLANISSSTSLENINFLAEGNNQVPGFIAIRIFDDLDFILDVSIDKCQMVNKRIRPNFRRIKGKYDGAAFTYSSFAGLDLPERRTNCPVNTLCHQGCPE